MAVPAYLLVLVAGLAGAHALADDSPDASLLKDCDVCPEMVIVPAGDFIMGAEGGEEGRPEGPPREISISRAFAIGRYEVTNREFDAFVADTGYETAMGCAVRVGNEWLMHPESHWTDLQTGQESEADHPVACVNWLDARAYVAWLAEASGQPYRLPSEAEWEYSARGGESGDYHWGSDPDQACAYANVFDLSSKAEHGYGWPAADCDDGFASLAPVGRLKPNGFGLHDATGNVWEWVEDCYEAPYAPHLPTDGSAYGPPPGQCERRSVRGGSWTSRISRQRPAWRGRDPEDLRYSIFGFRVARSLSD